MNWRPSTGSTFPWCIDSFFGALEILQRLGRMIPFVDRGITSQTIYHPIGRTRGITSRPPLAEGRRHESSRCVTSSASVYVR
jgi:hypothetical protein